jgi:hypothetical protein
MNSKQVICIIVTIIFIYNVYYYINKSKIKILNLIIYNDESDFERKMKLELERLHNYQNDNVKYLFVSFGNIEKTIEKKGNTLYIKGEESFKPGILDKTLKAMAYCYNKYEFDYLVRSNISTVIDFTRVPFNEVPLHKIGYAGVKMFKLYKLDIPEGIDNKSVSAIKLDPSEDNSLIGVKFVSGTSIILNRLAVQYILEHIKEANMKIIDDVEIGVLMGKITTPIHLSTRITINKIDRNGIVFRNKSKKREQDTERMKKIVDMIIERNNLSI